jgi:peptidoglycan/xylan/chitin deacetylase (PgdA/CDA1 family)
VAISSKKSSPISSRAGSSTSSALPRSAVVLAVAVLLLAGCGSSSGGGAGPGKSHAARTATAVRPKPHKISGPHSAPVPILMYHVTQTAPPGAANPDLFVSAKTFAAQMRDLARRGYHGVTLGQVFDYWRHSYALPPKPVVVSFDDGYASQYTEAFPVLRRLRWPGVLNLAVHNEQVAGGMPVSKLKKLAAAGWEINAHTINHVDVTKVDAVTLKHEVAGSRQIIRRQLHVPVDFFCYPSGRFDPAAIAALQRAGYLGALTTQPGLAKPATPYTLNRIRVNGTDGPTTPAEKIKTAA